MKVLFFSKREDTDCGTIVNISIFWSMETFLFKFKDSSTRFFKLPKVFVYYFGSFTGLNNENNIICMQNVRKIALKKVVHSDNEISDKRTAK